jgi:hypothetical protein
MTYRKYKRRFWVVLDADESIVVVCVYKKGAKEVVRRLTSLRKPTESEEAA